VDKQHPFALAVSQLPPLVLETLTENWKLAAVLATVSTCGSGLLVLFTVLVKLSAGMA
jgi:hypothetical protein